MVGSGGPDITQVIRSEVRHIWRLAIESRSTRIEEQAVDNRWPVLKEEV